MVTAPDVEAIAKLMKDYELDEFTCPEFTLKKSKHIKLRPATEDEVRAMAKHLEVNENEPWMSVDQKAADEWAAKGKP
jgi:hypothetical protein